MYTWARGIWFGHSRAHRIITFESSNKDLTEGYLPSGRLPAILPLASRPARWPRRRSARRRPRPRPRGPGHAGSRRPGARHREHGHGSTAAGRARARDRRGDRGRGTGHRHVQRRRRGEVARQGGRSPLTRRPGCEATQVVIGVCGASALSRATRVPQTLISAPREPPEVLPTVGRARMATQGLAARTRRCLMHANRRCFDRPATGWSPGARGFGCRLSGHRPRSAPCARRPWPRSWPRRGAGGWVSRGGWSSRGGGAARAGGTAPAARARPDEVTSDIAGAAAIVRRVCGPSGTSGSALTWTGIGAVSGLRRNSVNGSARGLGIWAAAAGSRWPRAPAEGQVVEDRGLGGDLRAVRVPAGEQVPGGRAPGTGRLRPLPGAGWPVDASSG